MSVWVKDSVKVLERATERDGVSGVSKEKTHG